MLKKITFILFFICFLFETSWVLTGQTHQEYTPETGTKEQQIFVIKNKELSEKMYAWSLQHPEGWPLPPEMPTLLLQREKSPYCQNLGFEDLNFTNWQGYTTYISNAGQWPLPPQVITNWPGSFFSTGLNAPLMPSATNPALPVSRHTIMTIAPGNKDPLLGPIVGYDSLAINPATGLAEIPYLPSGANGSVIRLGNARTGGEAEKISYKLAVGTQNSQITIRYAVCLNDGGHPNGQQPFFQMITRDQNGNLIPGCGVYHVDATNATNDTSFTEVDLGFLGKYYYRKWVTVGLDLSAYIGQNVEIEFVTADCVQGGHFGYAYVDVSCSVSELKLNFCNGSDTARIIAPATGYVSYQWYGPNSLTQLIPGATNDTLYIIHPQVGDTYYLQSLSVNGCVSTQKITLYHTSVYISDILSSPSCPGGTSGSISITAGGSSGAYSFSWYNAAGTQLAGNSSVITGLTAGTYSVVINSPGCGNYDTLVKITEEAPKVLQLNYSLCGNAGYIVLPPGQNYSWYHQQQLIPSPLGDSLFVTSFYEGETYEATYNSNQGCRDSVHIILHDKGATSLFVHTILPDCGDGKSGGATITLTPANTLEKQWTLNGPNQFSASDKTQLSAFPLQGLQAGEYNITITVNECTYLLKFNIPLRQLPVAVTVTPKYIGNCDSAAVVFAFGEGGIPQGCGVSGKICNNNTTITVGSMQAANQARTYPSVFGNAYANEKYQLVYSAADLLTAGATPGKITSLAFHVKDIPNGMNTLFRNYTVKLACSAALGFEAQTKLFLKENFTTVLASTNVSITKGWNLISFSTAYEWSGTENIVIEICYDWLSFNTKSFNAVMSLDPTSYNSYAVCHKNTSPVCLADSIHELFKLRPSTRFNMCTIQAIPEDFNYTWIPTTGVLLPAAPASPKNTVYVKPPHSQFYQLIISDQKTPCSKKDTFTIQVGSPIKVKLFQDTNICQNSLPVSLTALTTHLTTGQPVLSPGAWHGKGVTNTGGGKGHFNPAQTGTGTYYPKYSITGCDKTQDSLTIKVFPAPKPAFTYPNTEYIYLDGEIKINFTNTTVPDTGLLWSWNINELDASQNKHLSWYFNKEGNYEIVLGAVNEFGCKGTFSRAIPIIPERTIYVPNAFTPNSDGLNELFLPQSYAIDTESYQLLIYNRWGQKIFESKRPEAGWNGTYFNAGEIVESGIYVYLLHYINTEGRTQTKKGTVALIR